MDAFRDTIESYMPFSLNTMVLLNILGVAAFWLIRTYLKHNESKKPPGPFSYWLMVYHLFRTKQPLYEYLCQLRKEYGPIVSIPMLNSTAVYLHDFDLIKRTLGNPDIETFNGRPKLDYGKYMTKNELEKGFFINHGLDWSENKRVLDAFFKNLETDTLMEQKIQDEMTKYCEYLHHVLGQSTDPYKHTLLNAANVVHLLTLGTRYDYNDPKFQDITNKLDELTDLNIETMMTPYLGLLSCIPFFLSSRRERYRTHREYITKFLSQLLSERHQNYVQSRSDVANCYFAERRLCAAQNQSQSMFDDYHLIEHIIDFHINGVRLAASCMLWVYQYLLARNDIQVRIQAEIDKVVGKTRRPTYADRLNMPYTMAVIKEVMRMSCVVALNKPRKTTRSVSINEYHIPANTTILTNLYAIHHDTHLFGRHEFFNPDRFIKEGKCIDHEGFVPYSVGFRKCIAKSAAEMQNFLHLTTLLQKFNLKNAEYQTLNFARSGNLGGMNSFRVVFLLRR